MNLRDYLDLDMCVLNPVMYLDGEFSFPFVSANLEYSSLLYLNAKIENDKNLFGQYIIDNYLLPLSKVLGHKRGHSLPAIIVNKEENEKRKSAKLYFLSYILENFMGMNTISIEKKYKLLEQKGLKKIKIAYRNLLNEQLQKYNLLKNNINNSKYNELKDNIHKDYLFLIINNNLQMTFEEFVVKRIRELKIEINNIDKLFKIITQNIDVEEFIKCFDFDKLALFIAYSAVYQCEMNFSFLGNKVDNCLQFCEYYFFAVKKLKEETNQEYNPSVIIDRNKNTIDVNGVYKRYKKIRDEHPEFGMEQFTLSEIPDIFKKANKAVNCSNLDLSTEEGSKILDDALETLRNEKALKASWKIIPKGKIVDRAERIINAIRTEITDEEAARRVEYCYKFFEPSADINDKNARRCKYNYLYSLQGVGGFEGYTAYIYPTGRVVFEIFFEDEKTFKPVKYHATYVTDLYHFIELSKLSKQEITLKLKKDSRLGRKYYHRKDMDKWANEVESGIGNQNYTEDVIAYINSLLKTGELSASNIKKK